MQHQIPIIAILEARTRTNDENMFSEGDSFFCDIAKWYSILLLKALFVLS